jgi:cyanophycinase
VKKTLYIYILISSLFFNVSSAQQLILHGGGEPEQYLPIFVAKAGGHNAKIFILPLTEYGFREQGRSLDQYIKTLKELGVAEIYSALLINDNDANSIELINKVRQSTGIIVPGGHADLFMDAIQNTKLKEAIIEAVIQRNIPYFGLSAGSMILGDLFIVENVINEELKIELHEGLGILKKTIIEPHYSERGRIWRVNEAAKLGRHGHFIGIDEETAVIINNNNNKITLGRGGVHEIDR